MVDVVELKPGEDPPNTGQWIMVVASDEHDHAERKQHARGVTIMTSLEDADASVELARGEAIDEGIATVYVRRVDSAAEA